MSQPSNLIGTPVSKDVMDQLDARDGLISTANYQDDVALLYKSQGHNAFVKLTSFVSLTDSTLAGKLGSGISWDLAQKWTLYNGGVGTQTGNGVSTSAMNNKSQGDGLPSYGIGGLGELGIRPMPGIQSADISYAGKAGSIRQATIKFRCHNMQQLDVIDTLYFRFGFSMLLEWGATIYPESKNKLALQEQPLDIFKANITKEEVLRDIAKKRRSSKGNYDALLGLVTNYEWSATPDGGYDCTLNLVGIGSVIESIKINGNQNWPNPPFFSVPPPAPSTPATSGSSGLPGLNTTKFDATYFNSLPVKTNWINSSLSKILKGVQDSVLRDDTQPVIASTVDGLLRTGLNSSVTGVDGWDQGFNAGYMAGTSTVAKVDYTKVYTGHHQSFKGADGATLEYAYVPLSFILATINNSCTAYDYTKKKSTPLFYIDFHPETNFCFRLPDQISVDPSVCLLPSTDTSGADDYKTWLKARGINPALITNPIVNITDDQGAMAHLNNRVAGGVLGGYVDPKHSTRARVMNILVNTQYVLDLLDSLTLEDKDSNVYLSTFLTKLLTGIADVTGNINNFTVTYDDEANTVKIVDDQLVFNDASTSFPTIQMFGLSSVVRSYNLKTDASPGIGSMLAIEAMAGERTPTSDGRDASAFSALNDKLVDRLVKERVREINETTPNTSLLERAQAFVQFRANLYRHELFSKDDAYTNKTFYQECLNTVKNSLDPVTKKPTSVTARGILPVSLNFTMNGISTFQIWEGFLIPYHRLPSQYRNGSLVKVGFIINGITHQIANNTWITSVKAQMMNVPEQATTAANAITVRSYKKPTGGGGLGGGYSTDRDNNPFNIVHTGAGWRGSKGFKVASNSGLKFEVFDTLENGVRAGLKNLSGYFTSRKKFTVKQIINTYAPGGSRGQTTAATLKYVAFVTNWLQKNWKAGTTENSKLTFRGSAETDADNIKMFKELCKAILEQEGAPPASVLAAVDSFDVKNLA